MMGRQSGQMSMIILDLSELTPENHLLRKTNQMISFDFIYVLVEHFFRRCLSQPGTAGHYRIYSCYSVFQLS